MFKHSKTGFVYYSIREKINHYNKIISGKKDATVAQKRKAKARLSALEKLNKRNFEEPTLIVTNDYHFGNRVSKPRACVTIDKDSNGRILVTPVVKRTTGIIILNKDNTRQIGNSKKWIDSSEVYENKYIQGLKSLSKYDKEKVNAILKRK